MLIVVSTSTDGRLIYYSSNRRLGAGWCVGDRHRRRDSVGVTSTSRRIGLRGVRTLGNSDPFIIDQHNRETVPVGHSVRGNGDTEATKRTRTVRISRGPEVSHCSFSLFVKI